MRTLQSRNIYCRIFHAKIAVINLKNRLENLL